MALLTTVPRAKMHKALASTETTHLTNLLAAASGFAEAFCNRTFSRVLSSRTCMRTSSTNSMSSLSRPSFASFSSRRFTPLRSSNLLLPPTTQHYL